MIEFRRKHEHDKNIKIYKNDEIIADLTINSVTIKNKFNIVSDFITDVSKVFGEEFDDWFSDLIQRYEKATYNKDIINNDVALSSNRFDILNSEIPRVFYFVKEYIKKKGFDFSSFVEEDKKSKNSIFFDLDEITQLIHLSTCLKFYIIFLYTDEFKINERLNKEIYNRLMDVTIKDKDIIYKILNIIRSHTYRYNFSDKYMWIYVKTIQCERMDDHIIKIFNFIMNTILVLCKIDMNPIKYFVSIIKESVKWFLKSVYKGSLVYEDSISSEDIHTSNINNLKVFSYNDTLGRLKMNSYKYIFDVIENADDGNENSNEALTEFQSRLDNIKYIHPIVDFLVYPILSKVLNIDYKYIKTISSDPADSEVLSAYMYYVLTDVYKYEYSNFFNLLLYAPLNRPPLFCTYEIKDMPLFLNKQGDDFLRFNTKTYQYKLYSFFVGKCTRMKLFNIITGQHMNSFSIKDLEKDVINFYSKFFSKNMLNDLDLISERIMKEF